MTQHNSSSGTVEALRLLNKIVDLVDNEDAGEPLDDAIGYARAAIKALDEVAQGDGTKLVYVRRWRTLVKLPVKYADEIVEALRAPAQSHPQLSALDDASNACLELAAKHGYATGHGDTVADMIREFSAQIPTFEGVEKILTSHFYDGEPGDRTAIAEATKALMESRPVAQASLSKEIAKLMDKHGIAPAKPQFWLELEALASPVSSTTLGSAAK